MQTYTEAQKALKKFSDTEKAKVLRRFFKTGPGEYAEGDRFYGVRVPETRFVAKSFKNLPEAELLKLIKSEWHEERLLGLIILCDRYKSSNEQNKEKIYQFYLKQKKFINNWDLVDSSAHIIVGAHLESKNKEVLFKLAKSQNLWDRRIAIIATFHDIRKNLFETTLKLAEVLLKDEHDLIHKAVGWMLREVGKRNLNAEEAFLKRHYKKMPRTMLRYAIERFPEKKRRDYLLGRI